jgi:hypothetical protein
VAILPPIRRRVTEAQQMPHACSMAVNQQAESKPLLNKKPGPEAGLLSFVTEIAQ